MEFHSPVYSKDRVAVMAEDARQEERDSNCVGFFVWMLGMTLTEEFIEPHDHSSEVLAHFDKKAFDIEQLVTDPGIVGYCILNHKTRRGIPPYINHIIVQGENSNTIFHREGVGSPIAPTTLEAQIGFVRTLNRDSQWYRAVLYSLNIKMK